MSERDGVRVKTEKIGVRFRGLVALDGVSLTLNGQEIVGLIGPNGAGKTTLINVISGLQAVHEGTVQIGDRSLLNMPPHKIAGMGISRTFQSGRLFPRLSVSDNILFAGVCAGLSPALARRRCTELLAFFNLRDLSQTPVSRLTHGVQRVLTVARALVGNPAFVLLDEPAAGLNEVESQSLTEHLRLVRAESGCGILIVEHDMSVIMNLCDTVHVLNHGATLGVGPPDEIRQNEAVIEAYLGSVAKS